MIGITGNYGTYSLKSIHIHSTFKWNACVVGCYIHFTIWYSTVQYDIKIGRINHHTKIFPFFLKLSFSEGQKYPGVTPGIFLGGITPHGSDTRENKGGIPTLNHDK